MNIVENILIDLILWKKHLKQISYSFAILVSRWEVQKALVDH